MFFPFEIYLSLVGAGHARDIFVFAGMARSYDWKI